MSENAEVQSDGKKPEQSDQVEQTEQKQDDGKGKLSRSAEELEARLREVSQEAKTYRQKLAEEKKRNADVERKKLEEAGQFQELANRYKLDAEEAASKADKLKQAFAIKTVADRVSAEAAKLGCIDTDLLVNVLPLDQIKVDEMFNVDTVSVKTLIEDAKKQKPYLFQKQAVRVNDVTPSNKQAAPKPVEKMDAKEIEKILREQFGKK